MQKIVNLNSKDNYVYQHDIQWTKTPSRGPAQSESQDALVQAFPLPKPQSVIKVQHFWWDFPDDCPQLNLSDTIKNCFNIQWNFLR